MSLLELVPDEPRKIALVLPPEPDKPRVDISYGHLRSMVLGLREVLRKDLAVQRGQVVAMSMVNSVEFVVGFLATGAARCGARLSLLPSS